MPHFVSDEGLYSCMDDITIDEFISVCISRQVVDGEVLAQGINTPLVMAGYLLAKLTHAPNVCFASAIGQGIVQDWEALRLSQVEGFWLDHALMNVGFATATADLLPKYRPKEFFRLAQVDRYGNFNNIAINRPYTRLPGSGGIPDVTTYSTHVHLYVPRHSRVTFVDKVDFISGLGHGEHRLRGKGPVYCITDKGQFDWENGRMRLTTFHPNTTIEQIQAKTGFPLEIAPDVRSTPLPSQDELNLLRNKIDPLNIRKLETSSGVTRKDLLRDILAREQLLN